MQSDKYSNRNLNKFMPKTEFESDLDREIEDALGGKSIEELIDAEDKPATGSAGKGVKTGTVIDVDGDDVLVDMGGKSQGVLPLLQFEGQGVPRAGDTVEVTIEGYDRADGCLILSKVGAVLAADWGSLEEGQIVEGKVAGHNKGGLEMDLSGIRAFMPISQIEMFRVEDIAQYVNRRIRCQVIELDEENNNVIVSRRALLELEAAAAREKAWENLQEGMVVPGVVRNIMPYGAFVDIGGIDGLLHVGDMAHSRVEDPRTVATEGQQLQVKILKIDRQTRKVSLGLKQVMPDPWDTVEVNFPADTVQAGRVTKLMDFGAFVELVPGVEGLVPISEISFERRIGHP
ncbi:MAG: S1 RNA-binding domain-containing protein [Planctomycetes bacterium]|nr:S1 RNA-binding domain-containing protein [Planctomycetota bacterium]